MKYFFILFFITYMFSAPLFGQDIRVRKISASSDRMYPEVLKKHFLIKQGDIFSTSSYEKAQEDLHKLRVFKKLHFSTSFPTANSIDINIQAQDGWYIFPLAFVSGGKKSAAGVSLAAGNLFKQGESTFLFAGGSKDGFSSSAGLQLQDNFFLFDFTKLNVNERFYKNYWSNHFGVFSTTDDEEEYLSDLIGQVHMKKEQFSFTYMHRFNRTLRFFIKPQYIHYAYSQPNYDSGNHHQITAGLRLSDDIRQGTNMGALSGYGLTDKEKSLQNLPQVRNGYLANIFYTYGGNWTGSDYNISKLGIEADWIVEFKNRHMWIAQLKAQESFESPFSDEIISTELLSGQGRYDRLKRGKRGAGISTSFVYYLLRNQTGLLSLSPFYELAYVYTGGGYRPHSGAGATLAYKLWRFPFPLGINYTHNLQDGSNQVGFVLGGKF